MIGQKYNRWTVVMFNHRKGYKYYWTCRCSCGELRVVSHSDLKYGGSKSCGCLRVEVTGQRAKTHGLTNHKVYDVYDHIMSRCFNKKIDSYKDYGGRGITVCEEWRNDRSKFYSWALANGYESGLEIDRKNNNGNYSPENCRFVTRKVNQNNKRNTRLITYEGQLKTLTQWCVLFDQPIQTSWQRLKRGWSLEKTLTTPLKNRIA